MTESESDFLSRLVGSFFSTVRASIYKRIYTVLFIKEETKKTGASAITQLCMDAVSIPIVMVTQ